MTYEDVVKLLETQRQQTITDLASMEKRLNSRIDNIKTSTATIINEKINTQTNQNNQLATTQLINDQNQQIVEIKQATQELVKMATTQMAEKVYKKINAELGPKIQSAVEWVNYNTQDDQGMINDYRMEVERRHRGDSNMKLLTDGKDKRVISEHVRTFWSEDD